MCAWDVGNFNSDAAADFINVVVIREGLKGIEAALDETLNHDYIEDDMGAEAIAAGEVIAMLRGKPAAFIPNDLAEWHQAHQLSADDALTAKAIIAVEKAGQMRANQDGVIFGKMHLIFKQYTPTLWNFYPDYVRD